MIAVFLREPTVRDFILAALSGLSVVNETADERFSELVGPAQAGILVVPHLDGDAEVAWFRRLTTEHPGKPWILVTEFETENVANLVHWGGISEIVWSGEVPRALRPTVERLLTGDPIARFVAFLEDSGFESEELVQFLRGACLSRPLPTTIKGLCWKVGVKEPRIRYLWSQCFRDGRGPKEFLDTLILVHCLELHDSVGSWEKVAEAVHIRGKTLRAICHRVAGTGLSEALEKFRKEERDFLREWWLRSRAS